VPQAMSLGEVAAIVRGQLGAKLPDDAAVTESSTLKELGLSSLDLTEIYFAIEERVGTELDPTAAADVKTLGELVDVVNALVAQANGTPTPGRA
jgi:acyl carrier protein